MTINFKVETFLTIAVRKKAAHFCLSGLARSLIHVQYIRYRLPVSIHHLISKISGIEHFA